MDIVLYLVKIKKMSKKIQNVGVFHNRLRDLSRRGLG